MPARNALTSKGSKRVIVAGGRKRVEERDGGRSTRREYHRLQVPDEAIILYCVASWGVARCLVFHPCLLVFLHAEWVPKGWRAVAASTISRGTTSGDEDSIAVCGGDVKSAVRRFLTLASSMPARVGCGVWEATNPGPRIVDSAQTWQAVHGFLKISNPWLGTAATAHDRPSLGENRERRERWGVSFGFYLWRHWLRDH